jgi:two-component system, NarL family, sensor histidine kinase DevS
VVITPLFEGDEHVGFAKVTHDETERRAAEERIRELELTADRERIAGQLAGTIVHRTFEAGLSLQGTLSLVSDPVVTKHIDDVISLLDDMLRDLRAAIMDLDE